MSAATSTPRARAASTVCRTESISTPQPGLYATLRWKISDRHARPLADRDHFVDGLDDLLPFAANVARVRCRRTVAAAFADFDQLVGRA